MNPPPTLCLEVGVLSQKGDKSLLVPLFNELEKLNNTTTYNNGNIQPNRPVCNSGVPVQPVIHQPVQQTSVHQAPMQNRPANSIPSGYQQPKPQPRAPYVATQQQTNPYQQNNFSTNQFIDDINKKGEKMAVASLIISIVGLLLSCFGVLPGGILILLNYWFASQGLKTKKKGISITAIVLTSLSLLLLIVSLIIKVANL